MITLRGYITYLRYLWRIRKDKELQNFTSSINVMTSESTVKKIIDENLSVSRYGDGEFAVMAGGRNGFQEQNPLLAARLKEVISNPLPDLLVCIPLTLKDWSICRFNSRLSAAGYLLSFGNTVVKPNIDITRVYGDSLFTRFYMMRRDKSMCPQYVKLLKRLWEGKDLLIVEGEKSRLGVGNDLFDNSKSIKRILCPGQNAFDKYDEIFSSVKEMAEGRLVILALGMTATIFAYDLCKSGIRALDLGHIDVEYEWMLMGAKNKCAIPNKAVAEVVGGVILKVCNWTKSISNRLLQGSQPASILNLRFWEAIKYFTKYFGIVPMLKLVVIPRVGSHLHINTGNLYVKNLLKFQRTICKDIVKKYRNVPLGNEKMSADYKIWTCWWQGKEQMPEVIRLCHESLLRNANGHEVILITQDNYKHYVKLPDYIYEKVETGNISFSHFSDMIRLSLLCQYGGHWVDSALYITKPLQFDDRFHMSKMAKLDSSINQGRWCFGDIAGESRVKIFHYMLDCLLEYWKRYDAVVNYLMFDGFLRIAYEDMSDVHECIDNLPVYSPNVHETRYHFHERYEKERYDYLIANNDMLSLTWRINYPTHTTEGELTFYGKLLEDMNYSNN